MGCSDYSKVPGAERWRVEADIRKRQRELFGLAEGSIIQVFETTVGRGAALAPKHIVDAVKEKHPEIYEQTISSVILRMLEAGTLKRTRTRSLRLGK